TEDGSWELLEQAPVNAGEYGVKAHLAANQNYAAADSGEPTSFEITKATSTISINSYDGKVYDGNPVSDPTDITRTQNTATVTFKYYRADDTTTEIAKPSEVGAYKVKAFLSGDANYTDSESNFVDFNIAALGTTITLTYGDQVYTGNPVQAPQYTVEGSTGAVTIEWYEASDLTTPLAQAPTNVGNYVVKVSVAGTDTHTGASKTVTFQITPATSSISINNYAGKVYDGTAVSNPTDITATGSDGAVTFEWFRKTGDGNWEPLEQAPVNAGNYGVKAHLAANQNYTAADSGEPTPFEITKATSTISIHNYAGKVYDGVAVSNPTDITTTGSDGAVTFEWFVKTKDGNWESLGEEAPVNAGNYGVKAYLAANQNYTAADIGEPTPFEITKATSTISINSYEGKAYDGIAVSNPTEVTTTGSSGSITFEWFTKDETGQWISLGKEAPIDADIYGVKAYLAADTNYEAANSGEPVAFTIEKATSTIEILDDLNKTYDKEVVKEPTIKVEGTSEIATISWFKKESDGVTRAITWTPLTSAPVNAGEYKVVATVAENNNSLGATAEQEFTIAKAETNVSIEGTLDKEYDGVEVEVPNIKVEGSSGATTMEWYQKDVNGAWELLPNAPKEVGEYKVVVKVEEDENYLSVEVEQTFMISEKVEVPSTPEAGEDNTTTEEKVEGSIEGVQTGDASQTSMWTMLAGLSMSMM
ncbi:MAG: MBG domain-containing protein, partial [Erysipelotrichaceae bacterium]|nr:MBG domain-containing protein [Erysipelotrichaceae bacterium]